MTSLVNLTQKLPVFAFLSLFAMKSFAQHTYTVTFDASGRIVSTLPGRFMSNDKLKFLVNDGNESFDKYVAPLVQQLRKERYRLSQLKTDSNKVQILNKIFGIDNTIINAVIVEIDTLLKNVYVSSNHYVPTFHVDNEKYFKINASSISPFSFAANTESPPFSPTNIKNENKIDFVLFKDDPYKKLLFENFQATKREYSKPIDFEILRQIKETIVKANKAVVQFVDSAKKINLNEIAPKDSALVRSIAQTANGFAEDIYNFMKSNAGAISFLENRMWMSRWLWFQNAVMPLINPFNFKNPEDFSEKPDASSVESLQEKIKFRQDCLKTPDCTKEGMQQFDSMLDEIELLKKKLNDVQKAAAQFDKEKSGNEKRMKDFATTSQRLDSSFILKSEPGETIYWMRHHNMSNGLEMMNDLEKNEFVEDSRVIMLAHNLKAGESVQIHMTITDITGDASQLSDNLGPVIKQLSDAATTLSTNGSAGKTRVKAFDDLVSAAGGKLNFLKDQLDSLKLFTACVDYLLAQSNPALDIAAITDTTVGYHSQFANIKKKIEGPKKVEYYFIAGSSPQTDVKKQPQGNSSTEEAASANAPAGAPKASSESASDDPISDTYTYRINKLYRIWPMAGIGITIPHFADLSQDGGQTKVTQEANVRVVVGLKVYLWKTDIRSTKFISGKDDNGHCLLRSRTSLTVAFDVQKPLNNIYAGLGFDLWPGVCVNGGIVFNKYAYNLYSNGQAIQTKNLYRPGAYVGISTDLTLFAEIFKFLNIGQ